IDRDALFAERDALRAGCETARGDEVAAIDARLAAVEAELEGMPPLAGGRVAEDTLWACTTCGACQEVCPVFIEHPLKIIQLRQHLVLSQEKVPGELGRAFRNI